MGMKLSGSLPHAIVGTWVVGLMPEFWMKASVKLVRPEFVERVVRSLSAGLNVTSM